MCDRRIIHALEEIDAKFSDLVASEPFLLGSDRTYNVADFAVNLRARLNTPHFAVDRCIKKGRTRRKTATDLRTTRYSSWNIFQRCRKRIEEIFAWVNTVDGLTETRFRRR